MQTSELTLWKCFHACGHSVVLKEYETADSWKGREVTAMPTYQAHKESEENQ